MLAESRRGISERGDVVKLSYQNLGPDKLCKFEVELNFLGGNKCALMIRSWDFPMGLLPLVAICKFIKPLRELPFMKTVDIAHRFSRNDVVGRLQTKMPMLQGTDDLYSITTFDLFDESEACVMSVIQSLDEGHEWRGWTVPPPEKGCKRTPSANHDERVVVALRPSERPGRIHVEAPARITLPFPRWMLPTFLLKKLVGTLLHFALDTIGDTTLLRAEDEPTEQFYELGDLLHHDMDGYYGLIRARLASIEDRAAAKNT